MMTTEMLRRISGDNPVRRTMLAKNRVKKVKLVINPVTIPRGRRLPPPEDPDKTIGKIGKMQGERIVTMPARKAKRMRRIMDSSRLAFGFCGPFYQLKDSHDLSYFAVGSLDLIDTGETRVFFEVLRE